jgi:FAD/FMN-containing dehydrogenase
MASQLVLASAATTLLIIVSILIMRRRRPSSPSIVTSSSPETTILCKNLASALPDSVIFPRDTTAFGQSMNSYWAQQECEVVPACVVRPRDVQELSTATTILKREYDERRRQSGKDQPEGLFAIRGGGHSPIAGAASINGGVLIDLSLFKEVTPSEDGSSVVIGAGCKWMDVSKVLDEKGLAVVGGRNSAVGVGGLTLGGKLLFSNLD